MRRFCRNRVALVSLVVLLAIVLVAVFAPALAPYNPAKSSLRNILKPPSALYLLGTDDLGRDVLSRLIYGGRLSLVASVQALSIALVLGLPFGLIGGYVGGWTDVVITRFNDALMSFPALILAVVIVGLLGPNPDQVGPEVAGRRQQHVRHVHVAVFPDHFDLHADRKSTRLNSSHW